MASPSTFDTYFNSENIRLLAGEGLELMKKRYSKSSINAAEASTEFINFKNTYDKSNSCQGREYTQLLCLAISIINQMEIIDAEIRKKIITQMIKEYADNI